jgi:hypothetical protein
MPATARPPQRDHLPYSPYPASAPGQPAEWEPTDLADHDTRTCRYCCSVVPRKAKKCRACGEWVVRTSSGLAAPLLRLVGLLWAGTSLVGAAVVWYVGSAMLRARMLLETTDRFLTPTGLQAALYALIVIIVLQGRTFGLGLSVLARLAPRRPAWWT